VIAASPTLQACSVEAEGLDDRSSDLGQPVTLKFRDDAKRKVFDDPLKRSWTPGHAQIRDDANGRCLTIRAGR